VTGLQAGPAPQPPMTSADAVGEARITWPRPATSAALSRKDPMVRIIRWAGGRLPVSTALMQGDATADAAASDDALHAGGRGGPRLPRPAA